MQLLDAGSRLDLNMRSAAGLANVAWPRGRRVRLAPAPSVGVVAFPRAARVPCSRFNGGAWCVRKCHCERGPADDRHEMLGRQTLVLTAG